MTLSENPEEPTYLDTVKISTLNNVDELQIRLVKTLGGPEEVVVTDTVSHYYWFIISEVYGLAP